MSKMSPKQTRTGSLRFRLTAMSLLMLTAALAALDVAIYTGVRQRDYAELRANFDAAVSHAYDITPDEKYKPAEIARALSAPPNVVAVAYRRGGYPAIGKTAGFESDLPLIYRQSPPAGEKEPGYAATDQAWAKFFIDVTKDKELYSRVVTPFRSRTVGSGDAVLFISSKKPVEDGLDRLLLTELIGTLIVLGIAVLLMGLVVRLTLRPLDRVIAVASRISAGDMFQRLRPSKPSTELGKLAAAFDAMVDSLAASLASEREAREHAAESEERMRAFLSDASHELRTPVAGLQWSAEALLRHGHKREERERLSFQIAKQARRASQLIADLLSISRIERGSPLQREPFELTTVVEDEIQRLREREPKLKLSLSNAANGNGDCVLVGDAERVRQVISNLLDNACKVLEGNGKIDITVTRRGSSVELAVEDSGPGVPAADRERIFERFVRLDDSRARSEYGFGSGLGLAIARGIAEAHGGKLVCVEGRKGARFVLTLPVGGRARRRASAKVASARAS